MRRIWLIGLLFCVVGMSAQSVKQDSVRVYFRQGQSVVDLHYRDNAQNFARLSELYRLYANRSEYWLKGIRIVSSASPEGSFRLNQRLSEKRADAVLQFLKLHSELDSTLLKVNPLGEDWQGLRHWVESMPDVPHRDAVLRSLDAYPHGQEGEWDLKRIAGGEAYRYLYKHIYPLLRQTHVVFDVRTLPPCPDPVYTLEHPTPDKPMAVTLPKMTPAVPHTPASQTYTWALKTNALYDLALVPNVGVEVALGKDWSVAANWMYAWWSNSSHNNFWRIYGGEVEVRRWLGKKDGHTPLQGHHLGIYGQMVTYDFELGGRGYLADKWTYGAGLSYGYSLPIARRLNLDFSIGLGYLGGVYKEYLPIEGHYVWQVTKRLNWFGPTKAEVSLVWLWGGKNGTKKGGAR